jgi:ribosome-associated protein
MAGARCGHDESTDYPGEPVTKEPTTTSTERAQIAARAADDKKGEAILVLDVGDIIGIVDSFVITSASNTRLVRTIVDEIEKQLYERTGVKPRAVEGLDDLSWVLIDYGDLVVHVFLNETREFYSLERLWADAGRISWNDAAAV